MINTSMEIRVKRELGLKRGYTVMEELVVVVVVVVVGGVR